jgi:DNA-directed RNA polymerase subunit RPC12/RpoP
MVAVRKVIHMNTELELVKYHCPLCRGGYSISESQVGKSIECPHCHERVKFGVDAPVKGPPVMRGPGAVEKHDTTAASAILRLIGWILIVIAILNGIAALLMVSIGLMIAAIIGLAVGDALRRAGVRSGTYWVCSECGNRLGKESKLCPTCHAKFSPLL